MGAFKRLQVFAVMKLKSFRVLSIIKSQNRLNACYVYQNLNFHIKI